MNFNIGLEAIGLGLFLILLGYGSLLWPLKTSEKKGDTNLSLTAINAAYTLVVGGLVVIILGLLYMMGIIPWW